MDPVPPWRSQTAALGAFIRAQRRLADLSLREMATLSDVSNAYLSQVERGLHQPSMRVLAAIARALNVAPEDLMAEAGLFDPRTPSTPADTPAAGAPGHRCTVEEAVRSDPGLTDEQRHALLGVYASFTST